MRQATLLSAATVLMLGLCVAMTCYAWAHPQRYEFGARLLGVVLALGAAAASAVSVSCWQQLRVLHRQLDALDDEAQRRS
jgi:uncharacterized membrane protein